MASLLDVVKKNSVNRSVTLRIIDDTDGTPETGVVWDTAGIDLWYRRELAAVSSVVEATLATLTTAHSDGGFLHISDGEYRFDLPDAAFSSGANYVEVGGTVPNMIVIGGRVRLVDFELEVALATAVSITALAADLPSAITKNTALSNFEFLLLNSTDHVSPITGRTVTATRSIDGAAFGAAANSVTEVSSGIYKINLAASDLNGDVITLRFAATGADDRFVTVVTQPT